MIIEVSLCLVVGVPYADDFVSLDVIDTPGVDMHITDINSTEKRPGVTRSVGNLPDPPEDKSEDQYRSHSRDSVYSSSWS